MVIPKIIHYAFVVLHYGDATVTMEAIESIRSLDRDGRNVSVIVVDNASPNGTGEQVKKQIDFLPDFYYIHNEENLGFARGNNVGFKYAKNELKADFIILMNNDAVIESGDFFALVVVNLALHDLQIIQEGQVDYHNDGEENRHGGHTAGFDDSVHFNKFSL